jgi:hypothetical protein
LTDRGPEQAEPTTDGEGPASNQWRDERALARFELFLFTAVATVLVVRTALAVTGYPQVGGGGLHVAHVLWGGLLARTVLDTGLPSLISALLVIRGGVRAWRGHQDSGLRLIQSAVLLQMLYTQVVVFNREQFLGLIGFAFDLVVLAVLRLMLDPQVASGSGSGTTTVDAVRSTQS